MMSFIINTYCEVASLDYLLMRSRLNRPTSTLPCLHISRRLTIQAAISLSLMMKYWTMRMICVRYIEIFSDVPDNKQLYNFF